MVLADRKLKTREKKMLLKLEHFWQKHVYHCLHQNAIELVEYVSFLLHGKTKFNRVHRTVQELGIHAFTG